MIQRFNIYAGEAWGEPCLERDDRPDGDYVLYKDHDEAVSALQARIDRLMLEHCPDEMTPEQKANWKKHQAPIFGPGESGISSDG